MVKALFYLCKAASLLCRLILVMMIMHIVLDVMSRYLFHLDLPGTIAFVSNYYMTAIIFLPLAISEIEGKHIEVEVLTQVLPAASTAIIRMLGWMVGAAVSWLMMWATWQEALYSQELGRFIIEHGVKLPIWFSYYVLPIGFAAIALVYSTKLLIAVISIPCGLSQAAERADTILLMEEKQDV